MFGYKYCFLIALIGLFSCKKNAESVSGNWIQGNEKEKLLMIEDQFSGIHKTMMEIQYRFQELYWAGQDENWEYADHQIEEMKEALELGFIRRPERASSGKVFQENSFPFIEKAIASKDKDKFLKDFEIFKAGCNNCHSMEKVPFISITTPEVRTSVVRLKK